MMPRGDVRAAFTRADASRQHRLLGVRILPQIDPLSSAVVAAGQGRKHLKAGAKCLLADAVAWTARDRISAHAALLCPISLLGGGLCGCRRRLRFAVAVSLVGWARW